MEIENRSTFAVDPILELLVFSIEGMEKDESLDEDVKNPLVTLSVGGMLISGNLISSETFNALYLEGVINRIKAKTAQEKGPDDSSTAKPENSDSRHFIHIKNAVFYLSASRPLPNKGSGLLWRGRLTCVDGFAMGGFEYRPLDDKV